MTTPTPSLLAALVAAGVVAAVAFAAGVVVGWLLRAGKQEVGW